MLVHERLEDNRCLLLRVGVLVWMHPEREALECLGERGRVARLRRPQAQQGGQIETDMRRRLHVL